MKRDLSDTDIHPVRRKSLATQLTWVSILMVTLALLAVGTGLIFIADRTQRESAFRLQQQSADQVSQLISGYMTRAVDRLVFFLQSTPLPYQSPELQMTTLENLLVTSLPLYSQVTILDKKGNELSKISRFHTFLPEELIHQNQNPAFLTAIRGDKYMGPVAFLEDTGLLSVSVALPIKTRTGEISGVLIAEVNLSQLWQNVAHINVGKSGYAYLVDIKGRFVAYQKPADVLQRYGEDMSRMPPVAEFVLSGQNSTGQVKEYQGLNNDEVIGVYVPIKGTNWAVLVEQPIREAYAGITKMKRYFLGLMFLCIILAGGMGFYVSRRLIGPIRTLTDAAQRFGTGDLKTEFIDVKKQDEVGVLSHTFNKMQEELHDLYSGLKGKIEELLTMQKALQESEEKYRELYSESKRAEELYRSVLHTSADAIIIYNLKGKVRYINPSFTDIFGWTLEELEGKQVPFLPDSEREATLAGIKEITQYGRSIQGFETKRYAKDGRIINVNISGSRYNDHKGKPVSMLVVLRNTSEEKKLQVQLQQAQKMEAIGTLAGGIAHEFNNALMGIMGNLELLKMDLPEEEGRDRYFKAMKSSGYRMSRLTDQLLAYAQGGKYQPTDLKLDDVIIQTISILQYDLNTAVRVEKHFSKDISYIRADYTQMQMVLSAILANSNEAIEDEGVITISVGNETLAQDFTKQHPGLEPGRYVCLTIEDDGKGMDEETRSGIFDPFFTTKFQGRGMGMAAVYGIVKNHDGWIFVESDSGKGTVVKIYLPALKSEVKVIKEKKPKLDLVEGKGTILVIEDEDVVLEVTQTMLEHLGYRVMAAKTGKDAIHLTETFDGTIDLALLDIKLPDMEGGKLYPLIMKARPNLKVLVFSGYAIDGPAREILDAGAQNFIQKPFSIATLSEKVKETLEGNTYT